MTDPGRMIDDETIAVRNFLAGLWRGRWTVLGVAALCGVGAFLLTFLQPTIYTARATLLPQQEQSRANLLNQVATFTGISLDSEVDFEQLYAKIVHSDRVLTRLVERRWSKAADGSAIDLYEVFGVERTGEADSLAASELLSVLRRQAVVFSRESRTGFMVLAVHVPDHPGLAAEMANALVDLLDEFNRSYKVRKAAEQKRFVEERLAEATGALEMATDKLTEFVVANRNYESSPALARRYLDLEREVQAQSTVWIELRRQKELAGIEENKQLETISVLDRATPPTRKSSPQRVFTALVGALLGILVSVVALFAIGRRPSRSS